MNIQHLVNTLEELAPPGTAEDWDNVGLLLGDAAAEVSAVMTCLTLTPDVAEEAVRENIGLVVTHHPLMYKPVQQITTGTIEGRVMVMLMRHNVAVYSPHTAWDNAPRGINQQLAELLELRNVKPLREWPAEDEVKIVTFVPAEHRSAVQRALWDAGAGVIGEYRECSYYGSGTGTFHGSDASQPAVGQAGRFEEVVEDRLEVVCPSRLLDRALQALCQAHPYEEPAIDVYPRRSLPSGRGSGRYGDLPQAMPLVELNRLVCERLKTEITPFVGNPERPILRLGIACGAAAEFARDARRAGCDALLTGEARFHACLEARSSHLALILPGHYATERLGMERLAAILAEKHPEVRVVASRVESDPLRLA
jgi:dinuclear metal center YbgI/SA1388 family protein